MILDIAVDVRIIPLFLDMGNVGCNLVCLPAQQIVADVIEVSWKKGLA